MWFIGIDWAEKHLDFCIENSLGDVILRDRVLNDDSGFNSMLNLFMQSNIDLAEVSVSIESPHQRVVDFLLARSVLVYPVNPINAVVQPLSPPAVCEYRKSRKISGSKSDTADAQLLADYLREHHGHLRVWRLPYEELRQLSLLVEDRDKVVQQKVRLQNQLRSTLIEYFPQAVNAFSDLTSQTALGFLLKFPTFSKRKKERKQSGTPEG